MTLRTAITGGLGLGLALLSGCVSDGLRTDLPGTTVTETAADGSRKIVVLTDLQVWGPAQSERLMALPDVAAADARRALADRTRLTFGREHGSQVEYTSADGRAFLLYPGNRVVLPGRWSVRETVTEYRRAGAVLRTLRSADVCFQYGPDTYNPVTGNRGSTPECTPFSRFRIGEVENAPGDPLGLKRSQTPPVILDRGRTTLRELRARASG